jgi:hypothetical protein
VQECKIGRGRRNTVLSRDDSARWAWERSINIPIEIFTLKMRDNLRKPYGIGVPFDFDGIKIGEGNKSKGVCIYRASSYICK